MPYKMSHFHVHWNCDFFVLKNPLKLIFLQFPIGDVCKVLMHFPVYIHIYVNINFEIRFCYTDREAAFAYLESLLFYPK